VHCFVQFKKNNILQGSVATLFKRGRKFTHIFVINFFMSVSVKEF